MGKSEDNEKKEKIKKYIKLLFEYLGAEYCFTSGAFVIQDNKGGLLKLLKNTHKTRLSKRIVPRNLLSHTSFLDKNIKKRDIKLYETRFKKKVNISCKCTKNKSTSKKTNNKHSKQSIQLEGGARSNTSSNNNLEASIRFKIIKWYSFKHNNNKFIFIKPEDSATVSMKHLKYAAKRYVLKKSKISCRKHRREDCIKDNNCFFFKTNIPRNYKMIIKKGGESEEIVETYKRKGDEVFIAETISLYILHIIKNKRKGKIFKYGKNNNNIKLIYSDELEKEDPVVTKGARSKKKRVKKQ